MYYRLGCDHPTDEDGGHYRVEDGVDFPGVRSWALGQPFSVSLPDPIELELVPVPVPVSGFKGEPPAMFDGYMCLMSRAMVDALNAAGADNLQTYPATLRDRENGREFDYLAVNILGLLTASDIGASHGPDPEGQSWFDTQFSELARDSEEAMELAIFRLAEDTGTIVVHERVKLALQARGLANLTFTELSGS